ncbi:MAG: hypothetical protein ACKOX2_03580 [Microcystaceae cyanobacterium]
MGRLSPQIIHFFQKKAYLLIIQVNLDKSHHQKQIFTITLSQLTIENMEVVMANFNPSPATRYQTQREEPLTKVVTVKVSRSTKEKLEKLDNKADFIREAIAEKLAQIK